jgi:hypothetical protein
MTETPALVCHEADCPTLCQERFIEHAHIRYGRTEFVGVAHACACRGAERLAAIVSGQDRRWGELLARAERAESELVAARVEYETCHATKLAALAEIERLWDTLEHLLLQTKLCDACTAIVDGVLASRDDGRGKK